MNYNFCEKFQKVIEFMMQKCDMEREVTEFIEMYRFGDKVLKIEEMKQITKAFSKDE
jgi:hypothetical protein